MEKVLGPTLDANASTSGTGQRLLAIDRAKGFGIVLVVWGHLATSATPGLPLWFYISVDVIYSFHMPLFMYLSGFVFFLTNSHERFWNAPGSHIWKRFDRLMIPCLIFAILIVFGKSLIFTGGQVSEVVRAIRAGLESTLVNAPGNPVTSIWYLIVLFFYSVAVPILVRMLPRPDIALILVGLVLWTVPIPQAYYLERIAQYFVFFAIGGFVASHRKALLPLISAWYGVALAVLAIFCFYLLGKQLALLFCGIASLPAIHGLFMQRFWEADRLFLFLGNNSMAIYLINTIAIGLGQIVYTQFLPYQGSWFFFYSPVLFLVGLFVPVIIRFIVSKIDRLHPIKKYID